MVLISMPCGSLAALNLLSCASASLGTCSRQKCATSRPPCPSKTPNNENFSRSLSPYRKPVAAKWASSMLT
eukprot:CAMPEP_0115733920 /NCGR_PEP_ID=MMETSP0272-20121206/85914_1 /TAXON_ID=71861 /ORGANISM="Scrippsiella trochoidea, Strain CCMP3099" /LENGTH=70 /DNA_ID=CAMNT_0003177933 /DNA_START=76 /DNA_END=284 /DNA_ORIENTATION=+